MLDLGLNKNNSISDTKLDNKIEKPKTTQRENILENSISFKETLKEEIKKEKPTTENLVKQVETIEKKLEALSKNNELNSDELLEIKNILKDIKLLIDLLKEGKLKSNSDIRFENIIFSIEQFLNQLSQLLEKGDFKSLKELIKSFSSVLSVKEKTPQYFEKEISESRDKIFAMENNHKITLSEKTEETFVKEPIIIKANETIKPKVEKADMPLAIEKNFPIQKKELDFLKDVIFITEKKVEKSTENIVVRNYNVFTSSLNRANIEALISQITGKAVIIVRQGKSELKMQLFPPELGKMNMKFTLEDGQLTGKIVVSTKEAFMLFDQNKESLAHSLNQAGVNVGRIDISLGDFDSSNGENFETLEEKSFSFGRIENINGEDLEKIDVFNNSLYDGIINYLV